MTIAALTTRSRCIAAVLATMIVYFAAISSARSQPADDLTDPTDPVALRHYEQGKKFADTDEWDLAIKEFKAAALIEPVPKLFFNLGQANRFAGRYEEARRYYLRFLDKTTSMKGRQATEARAMAEQLVADMEAAASREPTGMMPDEARDTGTDAATSAGTGDAGALSPEPEREPAAPSPRPRRPWLAYSVLAGGAVLGIAAGGAYYAAESKEDQANAELVRTERDRLFEQSDKRRTIGHVCAAVGGTAVIGGVVLLILSRGSTDDDNRASLSIHVSPSWTGATASLQF